MDQETLAMQLIVHAGNAKSKAMEAIAAAREGNPGLAETKLEECRAAITEAHRHQTNILQQSFEAPGASLGMLMTHAQDHMMSALTTMDLCVELCALYERLDALERKVS